MENTTTTKLHQYIQTGNIDELKLLLNKGVKPDVPDKEGNTPLIKAIRLENQKMVELLISYKADVNLTNSKSVSPIIAAANRGLINIIQMLVDKGANINQVTQEKDSAISLAVWKNHTEAAVLLIKLGANVNNTDKFGETPLHDAAKHGNVRLLTLLIDKYNDINITNQNGYTALMLAAKAGSATCVQLLLDRGAKPDIQATDGNTACTLANSEECLEILEKVSPVTHRNIMCDGCGQTPLMGIRYKCETCSNFDYCSKCFSSNAANHPKEHKFVKMPAPKPLNKSNYVSEIESVLKKLNLNYELKLIDESNAEVRFVMVKSKGIISQDIRVRIRNSNTLIVYSTTPQRIPESRRNDVAELICRINLENKTSNFEMDLDDGSILYKTAVTFGNATSIKSFVDSMISHHLFFFPPHSNLFEEMGSTQLNPEAAFKKLKTQELYSQLLSLLELLKTET